MSEQGPEKVGFGLCLVTGVLSFLMALLVGLYADSAAKRNACATAIKFGATPELQLQLCAPRAELEAK